MKKNVKYIVFNNGMELVADVKTSVNPNELILSEPCIVLLKNMPDGSGVGVSLVPYIPMIKNKEVPVTKDKLLHEPLEPAEDILGYYTKMTSNIVLPNSKSSGILHG